jgi:hypothetical protein
MQPNVLLDQNRRKVFATQHRQTYPEEASITMANARVAAIVTKHMLTASRQAMDMVINQPVVLLRIRQIPGPGAKEQQDIKAMTLIHVAILICHRMSQWLWGRQDVQDRANLRMLLSDCNAGCIYHLRLA